MSGVHQRAGASLSERHRVAMVAACPFPANHGTPGAIRELSIALEQAGHEVHIVTYPVGDNIPTGGLKVHRVESPLPRPPTIKIGPSYGRLVFDALMIAKLVQVIREYDLDVIHAHNYEGAMVGAAAKAITGRPLVYNGINSMADELPSYRFIHPPRLAELLGKVLDYTVPRSADVVIALSDELAAYLRSLGMDGSNIVVIPPGVDVTGFEGGDGARVRRLHSIADAERVVIYAGALEEFQRIDLLLAAMADVCRSFPEARLLIANNIPNDTRRLQLLAMARDLGVESRLAYAEAVSLEKLPDYLAAADVAVVPRPSCPGFPIKLLNYMAAAKPTVSFAGSAKALCHGYNGYIAKNEDVKDLAHGIKLFLGDSELRETVGKRAKESLSGVYDWKTLARAIAILYGHARSGLPVSTEVLSRYLKRSYIPALASAGRDNPEGFLQSGPITYKQFDEERSYSGI